MLGLCGKVGSQLTEAVVGTWVFGDSEKGKIGFRIFHVKMAQEVMMPLLLEYFKKTVAILILPQRWDMGEMISCDSFCFSVPGTLM